MNSNYQWQRHQVNERVQTRMREAATHRLVKEDGGQGTSFIARVWNRVSVVIQSTTYRQRYEMKRQATHD